MKRLYGLFYFLILCGCAQNPSLDKAEGGTLKNLDIRQNNASFSFDIGTLPVYGEVDEALQLREHGMAYGGPVELAVLQLLIQGAVTSSMMKRKKTKLQQQADQVLNQFGERLTDIKISELSDSLPVSISQLDSEFSIHFSPALIVSQDAKFMTLDTVLDVIDLQSGENYRGSISVSQEIDIDSLMLDQKFENPLLVLAISTLLVETYQLTLTTVPNVDENCGPMRQTKYKKSAKSKVILGRPCGKIAEKHIFLTNRNKYLAIPSHLVEA